MMKFAKGTDKVLTIIYTVFSVLLIATFILLLIYAGGLMNNAGGSIIKAGSYSPDDYSHIAIVNYSGISMDDVAITAKLLEEICL